MPENMSQADIDALIKSLLAGEQPGEQQATQPAPAAPPADAAAAAMVAPPPEAAAPSSPVTDLGPITAEELAKANAAYDAAKAGATAPPDPAPPVVEVDLPAAPTHAQPSPPTAGSVDELVASLTANPPSPAAASPAPAAHSVQPPAGRPVFPAAGVPVTVSILMDIRLTMTVRLGRTTMKLKDVLNLAPGAVITLDSLATEPLDVLINNIPIMKAEAVVIGENYGVRIAENLIHNQRAAS